MTKAPRRIRWPISFHLLPVSPIIRGAFQPHKRMQGKNIVIDIAKGMTDRLKALLKLAKLSTLIVQKPLNILFNI